MAPLSREGLRHRLDDLDVVASRGPDRNPQFVRTQDQIKRDRRRRKAKQAAHGNKDKELGIGAPTDRSVSALGHVLGMGHVLANRLEGSRGPIRLWTVSYSGRCRPV